MDVLRSFNGDTHTKEALKEYIISFIATEGVRRIFEREDVTAIADAKILIDKAFEQLENDYGIREQPTKPTNGAR